MAKRAYSPKEVLAKTYKTIQWDGKWAEAFGYPAVNETWTIQGQSAAGKSSFVMQLARKLCEYGTILYLSYEEGVSQSFQRRLQLFHMDEVQGRFRIVTEDTIEDVDARLKRKKSPRFIIVDSFQKSGWSYEDTSALIKRYPRKSFIFILQEFKGQPMGKPAGRLKYDAGVKIRVFAYRAYCQGRFIPAAGAHYVIWEEGIIKTSNDIDK